MLPLPTTHACFRCLALDHLVRDCRDPIRCHSCRGLGHRARECAMSRSPRRRPTLPVPASRHAVYDVALQPRPTSPPPPSPNLHLTRTAAYNPIFLIPSSSNATPNFELPSRPSVQPRALASAKTFRPAVNGRGKEPSDAPPSLAAPSVRGRRSPTPQQPPPLLRRL